MECSPQPEDEIFQVVSRISFNPCFNGMLSATQSIRDRLEVGDGFNPCFNGMLSATVISLTSVYPKACFNPCFNGMLSATTDTYRKQYR